MTDSGIKNNKREEFFGAVSKNCKTFVGESKRAVKNQIASQGNTKNNVAIFRCWLGGNKTIGKKPIHKLRFKLKPAHHTALTNACLDFLSQRV